MGLDGARRDLATAERRLANLVEAIADGLRNASLQQQLHVLEKKCDDLRAQIGAPLPTSPVFPANLAATYRQGVTELERAIADNKTPAVLEAARALIERVIVHAPPDDEGNHPIELEGAIGGMLRAGDTVMPMSSASKDTAGEADAGSDLFTCSVKKALGADIHEYYRPDHDRIVRYHLPISMRPRLSGIESWYREELQRDFVASIRNDAAGLHTGTYRHDDVLGAIPEAWQSLV